MSVYRIPREPEELALPVERQWDGSPVVGSLRGVVGLQHGENGLRVRARFPAQAEPRIPGAAPGTRVDHLWEWDVAECFLVGRDGSYLEVELGPGGHFLLLGFAAPRRRTNAFEALRPSTETVSSPGHWQTSLWIPTRLIPADLCALNAFAILGGIHLSHAPLPGDAPDFHQPQQYPRASLEP